MLTAAPASSMRTHTFRQRLLRLGLAVGSGLVGLLAVELLLALVGSSYSPLRIRVQGQSDWRIYHIFEQASFVYDPALLWRPRRGTGIFNGQGYRGRELPATREAGSCRILAVGDSNTLGWDGPGGPNWPAYLEEVLSLRGAGCTVVNAGVWGYSSFQGVRRLERAMVLLPDLVLVSFGGNDAHRVTRSDADFARRRSTAWELRVERVLLRSRVGQLLIGTWDGLRQPQGERLVPRVDLPGYEGHLREMIRLARAGGAGIVLLTRPFVGESSDPTWWKRFAPAYNAATREVARDAGVPVIDLYEDFADKPDLFHDESHFNEAGHRAAARIVAETIVPILQARRGRSP